MIANTNLQNLSSEFNPYLLSHPKCVVDVEERQVLQNMVQEMGKAIAENPGLVSSVGKTHIFDCGEYFLKLQRAKNDPIPTAHDTHMYRIIRANQIRKFVKKEKLDGLVVIPDKFLCWSEHLKNFAVLSKKIILCPQDSWTVEKIRALALLTLAKFVDIHEGNVKFSEDGRIAIVDTEPLDRLLTETEGHKANEDMGIGHFLYAKHAIDALKRLREIPFPGIQLEESQKVIDEVIKRCVLRTVVTSIYRFVFSSILAFAAFHLRSSWFMQLPIPFFLPFPLWTALVTFGILSSSYIIFGTYDFVKNTFYSEANAKLAMNN